MPALEGAAIDPAGPAVAGPAACYRRPRQCPSSRQPPHVRSLPLDPRRRRPARRADCVAAPAGAGAGPRPPAPAGRALRRLINQRLGHRNFNAFVNGFRLAEALAALADPGRRDLPVLTIALTAGFQSIGPFNRAFKMATGLTPTEFRRQKLADS